MPGWTGVSGPQHVDALDDDGRLLRYVQNLSDLAAPGAADDALMAFQHRLCITDNVTNRVPWAAPEGYAAGDFALLRRAALANGNASLFSLGTHPPGLPDTIRKFTTRGRRAAGRGRVAAAADGSGARRRRGRREWVASPPRPTEADRVAAAAEEKSRRRARDATRDRNAAAPRCCGISVDASDQPSLNHGWAAASWEARQAMHANHTYFELGAYYFLANDASVPEVIRDEYARYGLCADEFEAFGHVPPQLYVRASNRLVGDYVMTQNNIYPQTKNRSIAVGNWSLDQHMTGKYAVPVPGEPGRYEVVLEGNFWPSVGPTGNWYRASGIETSSLVLA